MLFLSHIPGFIDGNLGEEVVSSVGEVEVILLAKKLEISIFLLKSTRTE
jgi:hypothetical protein